MRTITKTITVQAPANKVWEVLTSPRFVPEWADAFAPGARAESDWKTGSDITWTGDNDMKMQGKVVECIPERSLKTAFAPGQMPEQDFEQVETYALSPEGSGTKLTITHGPFAAQGFETMQQPWDQALSSIKSLAEGDASGRSVREAERADTAPRA